MVETLGPCPLPKMHESDQPLFPAAIPETPLRAVEISQRMAANPTIRNTIDGFRELLKIRKSIQE